MLKLYKINMCAAQKRYEFRQIRYDSVNTRYERGADIYTNLAKIIKTLFLTHFVSVQGKTYSE